jgi:spermidine/putrescine ABC transporter ATP-binding subunit
MASVRLHGISKRYGKFAAVEDVGLDVREGEFVTFLGASGSGKTTCLRIIAGFVQPDEGTVFIGGDDVTRVPPYRRNTGMVFQQYALFPHLTVEQNVAFGLKVRRTPRREEVKAVRKALELVRLEALAERYPSQLSGGQKQRVALARAVVIAPRVLLLDEPLGALDLKLREELQGEIKRVQQTLGITTIFVTHDQGEALSMSDRVVVMRNGRILQVDTPAMLYNRPNSLYVANFVGRTNFLEATVIQRGGERFVLQLPMLRDRTIEVSGRHTREFAPGDACTLAFRPEDGRISDRAENAIPATVDKSTFLGDGWMVSCVAPNNHPLTLRLPPEATVPTIGSELAITWSADRCLLLEPQDATAG